MSRSTCQCCDQTIYRCDVCGDSIHPDSDWDADWISGKFMEICYGCLEELEQKRGIGAISA